MICKVCGASSVIEKASHYDCNACGAKFMKVKPKSEMPPMEKSKSDRLKKAIEEPFHNEEILPKGPGWQHYEYNIKFEGKHYACMAKASFVDGSWLIDDPCCKLIEDETWETEVEQFDNTFLQELKSL